MYPGPSVGDAKYYKGSENDEEAEPMVVVGGRVARSVHRSYVGRRSGCSQPVVVALAFICIFVFFFFHLAKLMPKRPVPPPFAWTPNISRDMNLYLRPEESTALIQPENLCRDPPFLLFVVPSAVNNTRERDTIRRTWGQWVNGTKQVQEENERASGRKSFYLNKLTNAPKLSRMLFLIGKGRGVVPVSKAIQEESDKYGDIVVEDFIDSYTNLTLKSVFMLKWVHHNCPQANFVMKVDDDIFVNVLKLQNTLMNETISKSPLILGSLICGAKPIHDQFSKWYTPQYMFREGKYPNYLSGTGYVYSGELVPKLFKAALSAPYFHLEDVFLTGLCAKAIGVRPVDNVGFSYHTRALSPCLFKEVIMGHGVRPGEMAKLWNMLNQASVLAKCRPIQHSKLRGYSPPKCTWR